MLIAPKVFNNLDEAFLWVNRSFLVNPKETIQFIRGAQGFCEDLIMKVKKPETTINLYDYAFDPKTKWSQLIRSYVNPEAYKAFWEGIKKVTGTSYQFRFNNKESRNGPCLIGIVLTRDESKLPFTRAKIIWRTAELQRKFAADMVLIHNFFREIPEDCRDKVDIKECTLYLAQAFQSWRLIGPLVDRFCEWDEVDQEHDYGKRVVTNYEKIYVEPQPKIKFAPIIRMQKFHLKKEAGELDYCHPSDLSLIAELERLSKRG